MKITVKDFQSLQDVTILVDGFTTVYGDSGSGKSSLIRSVCFAYQNMLGDYFIRTGTDSTRVEIETDHDLVWEKTKKTTNYVIDGDRYNKAARNTPAALADCGVFPLQINKEEYWPQLSSQFGKSAQPFVIAEGPTVAASLIGSDRNVEIVSIALKTAQQDSRELTAEQNVLNNQKTELSNRLESYQKIFPTAKQWNSVEEKKELHSIVTVQNVVHQLDQVVVTVVPTARLTITDKVDQYLVLLVSLGQLEKIPKLPVMVPDPLSPLIQIGQFAIPARFVDLRIVKTTIPDSKNVQDTFLVSLIEKCLENKVLTVQLSGIDEETLKLQLQKVSLEEQLGELKCPVCGRF